MRSVRKAITVTAAEAARAVATPTAKPVAIPVAAPVSIRRQVVVNQLPQKFMPYPCTASSGQAVLRAHVPGNGIKLQSLWRVDDPTSAAFANSIGLLWHSDSRAASYCNPARIDCVTADKHPVEKLGGKAHFCFTPVISDGQSQGCKAMRYSLISREVITDCIELMHEGYHADAIITLAGCDKSVPASVMPLARKDGEGPGRAVEPPGKMMDPGKVMEAIGSYGKGMIDMEELHTVECNSLPGSGTCAAMFTACTMPGSQQNLVEPYESYKNS
eukprot:s1136_g7.t1